MRLPDYDDGFCRIAVFAGSLIDERTYVIRTETQAAVVDPHKDEALISCLRGVERVSVFLTHEHYDHISGVNFLRDSFPCTVYASDVCSAQAADENNRTIHFPLLLIGDMEKYHWVKKNLKFPYICKVDVAIGDGMEQNFSGHRMVLWNSPGHSPGGMSILLDGRYLFSGDNLLGNGMELKSIGADQAVLHKSVEEYEKLQGQDVMVFPGHGPADLLEKYIKKVKDYYQWN